MRASIKKERKWVFSDLNNDKNLEDETFWALASLALLLNCAKEYIVIPSQLKMYNVWYVKIGTWLTRLVLALDSHVIRSCSVSRRQANNVFAVTVLLFSWEVLQNNYMTDFAGNSEFCFPFTLNDGLGKKKLAHYLPWGESLKAYFC